MGFIGGMSPCTHSGTGVIATMFSPNKLLLIAIVAILAVAGSRACASRAGVVGAGLPGEDPALVSALTLELGKAGYTLTGIDASTLCDTTKFAACQLDLLVLPNAADLPVKSVQTISDFAKAGGDIIALNAPLWQRVLIDVDGKWTTHEDYQRANAGKLADNVLFDFADVSGWQRNSDKMDSPTTYEVILNPAAPGQRAVHAVVTNQSGWDSYGITKLTNPFPKGHALTVFSAKGSDRTTQLAIEWSEKDGSRWFAVVPLYPEWRQYVLAPKDFRYWTSTEGRGGRGDMLKPENAASLSFGLAYSHTGVQPGRHEYWIGPIGTAEKMTDLGSVLGPFDLPAMDTLCPSYKLFDSNGVSSLSVRRDQVIVSDSSLALTGDVRSPHPRPGGAGFDKRRDWRWIPLVEAHTKDKQWRGTPVTMMVNASGQYKGGVWASFGFDKTAVYKQPKTLAMIRQIAQRMRNGAFILDGGANFYTYFDKQDVQLGMRATNVGGGATETLTARVIVLSSKLRKPAVVKQWRFALQPGETKTVSAAWRPKAWPAGGYTIVAELLQNGKVIDSATHKIHVWKPKQNKKFMTVKNGELMLNGKRWRAHGVNYMPSSGIGAEDGEYFEHWIGAKSYDPEVISRDLDHCKKMGLNTVSAFVYVGYDKDQNMLDLLRQLDERGMKANVGLRPGMPHWFDAEKMKNLIKILRLAENDTVFAYDIAWEPMFGPHTERKTWDGEWEKWIVERYGSVANAEKDWGFAVPRGEDGKVTNPPDAHIVANGEWRVMVAAYRRFLDFLVYKKYSEARRVIKSVDPNHMVSFRMAEAGNPTVIWGGIAYDFPYLAAAVDILQPEAYGRIGDWERVKPGWFEFAYAKWAAPEMPMLWAEMGVSTWDLGRMSDTAEKLEYQSMYHKAWYRMLNGSGASGVYFWWYPGGFRTGENSNYGIINPDGTDKPVTPVIRANARGYLNAPSAKKPDYWIEIDRDAHPEGLGGVYAKVKDDFWAAIDKGLTPGLRTKGTGTDSSNCPAIAVGNVPLTGSNPPKYLDVAFDRVEVMNADGKWVEVPKDGTVKVAAGKPVMAKIEFRNLGEAKLLKSKGEKSSGAVFLVPSAAGQPFGMLADLPRDVPHLAQATVECKLNVPVEPTKVTLRLATFASGMNSFGEVFTFTVEP